MKSQRFEFLPSSATVALLSRSRRLSGRGVFLFGSLLTFHRLIAAQSICARGQPSGYHVGAGEQIRTSSGPPVDSYAHQEIQLLTGV